MNVQFSDLISEDYLLVSLICVAILLFFLAYMLYKKLMFNKRPENIDTSFLIVAFLVTAYFFGIGHYDSVQSRIYFDRFQAFHESHAGEQDFWINPKLQELASSGTIDGHSYEFVGNDSNNKAIAILKKHFPSEDYNVEDLNSLRKMKNTVQDCVPKNDRKDYLIALSEIPVAKNTMENIKNEIMILYKNTCKII